LNVYEQLKFEYIHECPICGALEETWKDEIGEMISHGMHVIYRQCVKCGIGFQNPRPTEESVIQAYRDNSYREIMTETQGGAQLEEVKLQSIRAQRIAAIIKEENITPRRFLDVGSSLGILTYQIHKAFDCEAWGHELSKEFRELAAGFEGVQFVAELEDLEGKFDVITSIHVLEHLIDPVGQLIKLRDLLTEDGVLILECPDGRNTVGMSLWHYVVFVFETMTAALEEAGFEAPLVEGMRDRYFNEELKINIPGMVVVAPKNGPYVPPTPQKPLTD